MKRILIALAVLMAVQVADAQVKSPAAAKKSLEKAEVAAQHEKKGLKPATWVKLANAYMDAYNAPAGAAWIGASREEVQLILAGETPTASEQVVLAGTPYIKDVYANRDYYYNNAGQLAMIIVTQPVAENALEGAFDAYRKAYELDVKKSKEKDIRGGLEIVSKKFFDEGMNCYMFEDYAAASSYFEKAVNASDAEPLCQTDTIALYNAGFTAWMVKDYPRAAGFFQRCLDMNYYYEGGEVFAKLADVKKNLGDNEGSRVTLEEGFSKFPQSQSILIGLINYYVESGDNADRLFVLINEAKQNEPNNASLYYVEGNIYNELRQKATDPAEAESLLANAVAAYDACSGIDANYAFGYIGKGVMYYNIAIEIQEKAQNEMDDRKWMALNEQFENTLMKAIEPFEKAYEVSQDNALKVNIAEYLKNIYYRFYSKGAEYEAAYAKYDSVVKTGQAQ